MPFLRRVTAGRGVPDSRIAAVAEHYYAAGGASPLNAQCRALLAALGGELADLSLGLYWGNRNWHPLLEDVLGQMKADGIERALAFVTSAYGGYSSCRQYLDDIAAARQRVGAGAPVVEKLRPYYNHPGWVSSWAASLSQALEACRPARPDAPGAELGAQASANMGTGANGGIDVIFTAHSIPVPMAVTSPYVEHVTESARLTAEAAGAVPWRLAWQSRSGAPGSPWLEPDVRDVVEGSTATGVVVVPIGFVCENMEVVHDLDVEAAEVASKKGVQFVRAGMVASAPAFVGMVRELVAERMGTQAPRRAIGQFGPWPDNCPEGHCPAPARLR
jgi:protoporphyrin/coproporphyrin ferrochelatase